MYQLKLNQFLAQVGNVWGWVQDLNFIFFFSLNCFVGVTLTYWMMK